MADTKLTITLTPKEKTRLEAMAQERSLGIQDYILSLVEKDQQKMMAARNINDALNSLPESAEVALERVKGLWITRISVDIGTEDDWARLSFVGLGKQPVAAIQVAIERWNHDRHLLEGLDES